MTADSMVAGKAADLPYLDALARALVDGALPDETGGFGDDDRREAAEFVAACAQRRPPVAASKAWTTPAVSTTNRVPPPITGPEASRLRGLLPAMFTVQARAGAAPSVR